MKKLLKMAAIGTIALAAPTAQAMTWEVLCVKQGPVRQCPSKPLRELDPLGGNPGNTPGYPIGLRSIPSKASVAEKSDAPLAMNFFSLGFGGVIILRSSAWIGNGPGNDVTLYETTWGNPVCRPDVSESALVEFSQDGINWITPGPVTTGAAGNWNACHNASFDISPLMMAQYVRITDRTNPKRCIIGDGNDAYDVDGLEANHEIPPTGGTPPQGPVCDYEQGVASQFVGAPGNFPGRGIVAMRKNFANANINEDPFPAEAFTNPSVRDAVSDVYNFWSLGFGGRACFRLPYTLFNGPGPDIYSFETTWQNQPCPNYPEKADVSVSADGINWSQPVRICKDALSIPGTDNAIDLSDFGPEFAVINYIRYYDATNPADFGAGADGYDIDNIYLAQMPPEAPGTPDPGFSCWGGSGTNARRAVPQGESLFIDGGVPEEMLALEFIGSNVVDQLLSFRATIAEKGVYSYSIRNSSGQEMSNGILEAELYETPEAEVSVNHLPSGVYFLSLHSPNSHESLRFVKN